MVFFGNTIISLICVWWDFYSVIQVLCKPALAADLHGRIGLVISDVGEDLPAGREGRDDRDDRDDRVG